MRPGRVEDLPAMVRLWGREVLAGRRDSAPHGRSLQRILSGFDWEACSRVEDDAGGLRGAVLVMRRQAEDTTVARVEAAVTPDVDDELLQTLIGWGLGLSRAAGAHAAQVWRARGTAEWLSSAGLQPVRPWWRMDRTLDAPLPPVAPVDGYRLLDSASVPPGASVDTLPRHRRRGLARWLLTESLARLKAAGAVTASLYVDGKNEHRAPDLYSELGFEVTFDTTVWEATFP